jgi:hypothetical protein
MSARFSSYGGVLAAVLLGPAFQTAGKPAASHPKPPPRDSGAPSAPASGIQVEIERHAREDEQATRAWSTLSASERRDAADYFMLEANRLDTFQASLVRFVLKTQDRDFGMWPRAAPAPVFSSKEHTPENDIPRHDLGADSAVVQEFKKLVFRRVPERRVTSSFTYDYASRELRTTGDWNDPERIFKNGLAGYPPLADLCEALVERALDDGSEQKALAAFGHAYSDRSGGVYTGITLYDAWTSHAELEMPDVENLGIVHDVLGDWKTWRAPVPAPQQDPLYAKVGEIYLAAHHHRGLRCAIARCFLSGTPVLRDQYDAQLDNFHVLWEESHSTPADLASKLPSAAQWATFLDELYKRCQNDGALYRSGVNRRMTLNQDAGQVRALLLRVLDELGANARATKGGKAPPDPKKTPNR